MDKIRINPLREDSVFERKEMKGIDFLVYNLY